MKIRGTLFLKIKFAYRHSDNDDVTGPVVFFTEETFLEEQFMRIYDTCLYTKCAFRMS